MYAVMESGGKQYRVQLGDVLTIEKLSGEVQTALKFDQVLFYRSGDLEKPEMILGKPYISGASVHAEIVGQGRGDKILIVKMKRRKQYRRTQGHRQEYTQVLITQLDPGTGTASFLSEELKKEKQQSFYSQLKPKGDAFTKKLSGSRQKRQALNQPPASSQALRSLESETLDTQQTI